MLSLAALPPPALPFCALFLAHLHPALAHRSATASRAGSTPMAATATAAEATYQYAAQYQQAYRLPIADGINTQQRRQYCIPQSVHNPSKRQRSGSRNQWNEDEFWKASPFIIC